MAQYDVLWDYDKNGEHDAFNSTNVRNNVLAAYSANTSIASGFFLWLMQRSQRRVYAYNPIIFKAYYCKIATTLPSSYIQYGSFSYNGTTYYYFNIDDAVNVELTIYADASLSNAIGKLKATIFNGCATFNIAPLARAVLAEEPAKWQDTYYGIFAISDDKSVMTRFYVKNLKINSSNPNNYLYYFIQNAVAQTGSDGDKKYDDKYYFLQDQRHFRINRKTTTLAYPEFTFLSKKITGTTLTIYSRNSSINAEVGFSAGYANRIAFDINNMNIATMNSLMAGSGQDDRRLFTYEDVNCPPERFFPIRWRNRKGVLDYYSFIGTAYKIKDSKTTGVKDRYIEDGSLVNTNRIPYAVEGSRKIRLGIDNATTEEIDILTRLPYSPWIEWYDFANEMWTRVTVSDFKNEENMASPSNYYEITLECPAINMQF